jgi:hypothetical protein
VIIAEPRTAGSAGRTRAETGAREAAQGLLEERYVLPEDVDLIVADAAERWDYVMGPAG